MRSGCALGPPRNRALQAAAPSERQSRARSNSTPMPRPGAVLAQAPLPASTHETAAAPEQSAVDTAAGSGIVSRRHGGGGAATAAGAGADGTSATAATAGRSSAAPLVTSTSPQRRVPRPAITIAELDHGHMDAVRAIHTECFPVKYTDRFYRSLFAQAAVHVNLVAVDEGGQVVGVVTARDSEERRPSDDATELCPCIAPTDVPWPCNPWCAFWCCCEAVNRTGYVMTLGVTAAMRGCGIGRRLLRESMLRLFRDHGCADIALDCLPENEAAIALYQAHAFQVTRRLSNHYYLGGTWRDALHLVVDADDYYALVRERGDDDGGWRHTATLRREGCCGAVLGAAAGQLRYARVRAVHLLAGVFGRGGAAKPAREIV